jgi:hypothetical protein
MAADQTEEQRAKRHDHRQSLWLIAGGAICWCYQCGAWRLNNAQRMAWHKPSGIGGRNPALSEIA